VAALCRVDATFFHRSLRMLALGGAGLGVLSAVRLGEVLLRNPGIIEVLRETPTGLRISPQIADYIAAGSYFALCWLVSLGLAMASRRWRPVWLAAGVPLMAALYLTGSRSVIAAALGGLAILAFMAARHRTVVFGRVGIFALTAVVAMVISYPWMTGRDVIGETAALSLQTRQELARTTLRVIETRPLFGVGFDRFQLLADGLASPELNRLWQGRKNPHNDFLRVGAELGLVGLGLFLWIMVAAGKRIYTALRRSPDVRLAGVAGGLVAFIITSMVSDPLMVREVSYAFWIALGLGVGHAARSAAQFDAPNQPVGESATPPKHRVIRAIALLLGCLLVLSIPFRARQELGSVDLTHVRYGFYDWDLDPDGIPNRWTGPRATVFVDGRARLVDISLSSTMLDGALQQVEVRVDGRLANRIAVGPEWQRLRISLPAASTPGPRRIDLVISPSWVPADVIGNNDQRVLGVKVGPISAIMPPGESR
jgi:O-antigen ligase